MTRSKTGCRIGELASAAGVTPDALRYYERERLLPKASRTNGGFRVYPPETVQRVQFIKRAQSLGLSLREIRELVGATSSECASVRANISRRLAEVEDRTRELTVFRNTLRAALKKCDSALGRQKNPKCPVASYLGKSREGMR